MTELIEAGGLALHCIHGNPDRVAYILYPFEMLGEWAPWAARKYDTSIVCVTCIDWDNDLSPWPAPGQPPGSPDFRGNAKGFLDKLQHIVVPAAEKTLGVGSPERWLVGVSMSGLFALWQRFMSPFFPTVATLSGSFWYNGFADWVDRQPAPQPLGRVYMLLGRKESLSPIAAFRPVGDDTQRILQHLQKIGVPCHFDWVAGNHYANPLPRLDLAFTNLTHQI